MNYSLLKRKIYNSLFNTSLLLIGGITLILIVFVKSMVVLDFRAYGLLIIYTFFVTTFELSRLVAAILYPITKERLHFNSHKNLDYNYEPFVSFVVPCKDEEKAIGKTIDKCFEADYPSNKLEVIVINDGSTDNTINVLKEKSKVYGNRLVIIDWKVNKGKRHGMYAGFKEAKGEIIIQLDSDSYIDGKTFKYLIEPFSNPEIGAICAHADPENADENWLTKMQAAYYFMSFRILKAAESTFFAVFCCSGCSSAYRKSIVLPILEEWLDEKFLGLPVTWGDDRALTNWVIKCGYKTAYTDSVQAYTICPNKLKQFLKQQVRWKKGWFVNSIFASKFIVKRNPFIAFTYFFPLIFVTLATPFMAAKALIINPIFYGITPFYYIVGVVLVAVLITSYYRYLSPKNKYWPYLFVWSGINMILLSFILFYALGTIQNRKWGTR